jgi:hypothetical protein
VRASQRGPRGCCPRCRPHGTAANCSTYIKHSPHRQPQVLLPVQNLSSLEFPQQRDNRQESHDSVLAQTDCRESMTLTNRAYTVCHPKTFCSLVFSYGLLRRNQEQAAVKNFLEDLRRMGGSPCNISRPHDILEVLAVTIPAFA